MSDPSAEQVEAAVRAAFESWLREIDLSCLDGKRGLVAGGMWLLELLRDREHLVWDSCLSKRHQGQLHRISGARIQATLDRHGCHSIRYLKEGGRTNRSQLPQVRRLHELLVQAGLATFGDDQRYAAIDSMQAILYRNGVQPWYCQQGLRLEVSRGDNLPRVARAMLQCAQSHSNSGAVLQHMVGALLQTTHPDVEVETRSASAADSSADLSGDFHLGTVVIHVTTRPGDGLIEKCQENLRNGFVPWIVTTDAASAGLAAGLARQAAVDDQLLAIGYCDLFVQSITIAAQFDEDESLALLRRLLAEYNRRVERTDRDKGMLIQIPPVLSR